jgi:hypothetical protein
VEKLKEAISRGESRVRNKAESLLTKVQNAIDNGTEIRLHTSIEGSTRDSDDAATSSYKPKAENLASLSAVNASLGELCCFKIYPGDSKQPDLVKKMLSHKVRFVPRGVIERAESFGVDRMLKGA